MNVARSYTNAKDYIKDEEIERQEYLAQCQRCLRSSARLEPTKSTSDDMTDFISQLLESSTDKSTMQTRKISAEIYNRQIAKTEKMRKKLTSSQRATALGIDVSYPKRRGEDVSLPPIEPFSSKYIERTRLRKISEVEEESSDYDDADD